MGGYPDILSSRGSWLRSLRRYHQVWQLPSTTMFWHGTCETGRCRGDVGEDKCKIRAVGLKPAADYPHEELVALRPVPGEVRDGVTQ